MDEINLPRLVLRPNKKHSKTSKQDALPQLHLKQRQAASQRDTPRFSTSSQKYTPGNQEPERYQPPAGQSRLGKRLVRDTQTGDYRETRDYVDVPQASRRQGLYITGIQGTGKSVLIENLIIQDIKENMGVCLLDPHGDLTQVVLSRLPDRRVKDVIYLDINNYRYPFGVNLFNCPDLADLVEVQKTIDQVIHVFEKLLGVSHETPLILEYLQNCTHTLIANPGYTMADIPLLLQDGQCRKKLVANVTDSDVQLFWRLHEQKKPADQSYDISSTLRRVRQFLQPLSRPIVGQSASTIDIRKVMDEGKILLVKLDTTLESITSLIGSLIIALFLNAAKSRADLPVHKRRQFNLYADEFQRFATEDFATLLEEARKFGIGITIAHQNGSQLETSLKERARSVANLVVFKVNSKDADELAGEFNITPQEAWEEELEEEWVEVIKPQRHERIEEQVEVEVEEDIEEISQNPVDYLIGARGTHGNARVQKATQAFLMPLTNLHTVSPYTVRWTCGTKDQVAADLQEGKTLLNTILVDVMGGHLKPGTREYVERIAEYCVFHANVFRSLIGVPFVDLPSGQYLRECSNNSDRPELRAPAATYRRCLLSLVWAMIADNKNLEESKQHLTEAVIGLNVAAFFALHNPDRSDSFYHYTKQLPSWHPEYVPDIALRERWYPPPRHSPPPYHSTRQEDREAKEKAKQLGWQRFEWGKKKAEDEARKEVPEIVNQFMKALTIYIPSLVALCEGLAVEPIKVPTGQKRMVKRIQPHITYLTHESEKITHPRVAITHPQRTYADVHNEVASQLTNLPVFTAQVKIATDNGIEEHTIKTLDPKQDHDRPLFGQALQDRIDSIKKQNIQDGYVRERTTVEEEIKTRQGQCSQPPEAEPPISRRPPR